MAVICIFFVPVFSRMKVYTAYEYLENRFDGKTRRLTSFLFLLQRGVSTGISVFAPSIILSSLLGWNIYWTNLFMGGLLIIYTMSGGAKAVAYTQQLQLIIIFIGMFLAAYMVVRLLPEGIGFTDALEVSGKLGKLNVITTGFEKTGRFDWGDKYNIFSGIIGGFFLALSYFGADQSQVGRYLTAKSIRESRMSLLMNGFIKVPMQFLILLIGTLVFTFYQFTKAPVFFNEALVTKAHSTVYKAELEKIEYAYSDYESAIPGWQLNYNKLKKEGNAVEAGNVEQKIISANQLRDSLRKEYKKILSKAVPNSDTSDTNYIFLRFVVDNLPAGLVGLLIAIIFLASWGSIAAAINSLASCTMVDFHRRFAKNKESGEDEYRFSKRYTLIWGVFCIVVAMYTYNLGNSLIETVNELGSLFYGSILGVFLVAFFFKKINNGNTVFYSALLTEVAVLIIYILSKMKLIGLGFLWLNPIGAIGVIVFSLLLNGVLKQKRNPAV
jgi:Na+/proline symporter